MPAHTPQRTRFLTHLRFEERLKPGLRANFDFAHAVGQHRYEALTLALAPVTATLAPDPATQATYESLLATYLTLEAEAKG